MHLFSHLNASALNYVFIARKFAQFEKTDKPTMFSKGIFTLTRF
jgi:hypothetical protein